jgi:hypothetical protein
VLRGVWLNLRFGVWKLVVFRKKFAAGLFLGWARAQVVGCFQDGCFGVAPGAEDSAMVLVCGGVKVRGHRFQHRGNGRLL